MKITTKGQVTIPVRVRDYLGIAPHVDVDFRISGGNIILVKHEGTPEAGGRFASLRGALKGKLTTQQWTRQTRGD